MANSSRTTPRPNSLEKESDSVDRRKQVARRQKTYCICGGPSVGLMIECETCREWFHTSCVGLDEKILPSHFDCQTCIRSKELEDTIVEALSILAEQAATQSLNYVCDISSDRDEESMPDFPLLASDDKENIPNVGVIKVEDSTFSMKKRKFGQSTNGDNHAVPTKVATMEMPCSPMSDIQSGSEDSSPSTDPPSSPSSPTCVPTPQVRRSQSHSGTKTYTRKNKKQIGVLEKYYEECQTPDAALMHVIATESNLPEQKVARWFYDKRRRSKQLGH